MPFFSVVIPVHNGSRFIHDALDSLDQQTMRDFEVILVDDGSTDDSLEIIQAWAHAKKDNKVTVISQSNLGLGAARNRGVEKASGTWLVFLDADDRWVPDKLERIESCLAGNGSVKWGYHPCWNQREDGKLSRRRTYILRSLDQLLDEGSPIQPSACFIHTGTYRKVGGFEEDRSGVEDIGLWVRLLKSGHIPEFLPFRMTYYRIGVGVSSQHAPHLEKVLYAWSNLRKKGILDREQVARARSRTYYEAGCLARRSGDFRHALRYFRRSDRDDWKVRVHGTLAKLHIKV
ncbi:MAG: glycosyltransferase [Bacteroidota bacterium]|nr:glycosyltransferase [Bacteroidota bacterium]MDX5403858.1 glycosyltransferase [Bacteroidota bacterium]MDX5449052.1 glycosyltransferase [Bacteroidota bacterium]MDX5504848.1 glycosyltransferase [Bacteroidota bacterium]